MECFENHPEIVCSWLTHYVDTAASRFMHLLPSTANDLGVRTHPYKGQELDWETEARTEEQRHWG